MKVSLTIEQLESLLYEQKLLVIEGLQGRSGYCNSETTAGQPIPLTIDKEKFKETGLAVRMPNDVNVLKKYLTANYDGL